MLRSLLLLVLCAHLGSPLSAQPQDKPIKRPAEAGLEPVFIQGDSGRQVTPASDDAAATAPADLPTAVIARTGSLVFHVSPLSNDGLLSEQIEDALKAIDKANGRATIMSLRAFVAGTGDMRRVRAIVLEMFEDKRWPLPALTTVQIGGLPTRSGTAGAQVVIEAISQERDLDINPNGIAFFPPQHGETAVQAVEMLAQMLSSAQSTLLHATCYADSAAEASAARTAFERAFPDGSGSFLQVTRYPYATGTACEGVGRLTEDSSPEPDSGIAIVRQSITVFTASQLAFGQSEDNIRLAHQRLGETLNSVGANFNNVVVSRVYAPSPRVMEMADAVRGDYLNGEPGSPPTVDSQQRVEGLPSYDASLAIEMIAAVE